MHKLLRIFGTTFLLCSATANVSAHKCDLSTVDETSADTFIQSYYERLSKGVNLDQHRIFFSGEQNDIVDNTIAMLAQDLDRDFHQEAQRLMDSYGVEASCQSLTLKKSRVWGVYGKFGAVSYDISPTCTDWSNKKNISFDLRYSKTLCEWVITDISSGVKY